MLIINGRGSYLVLIFIIPEYNLFFKLATRLKYLISTKPKAGIGASIRTGTGGSFNNLLYFGRKSNRIAVFNYS